MTGLPKPGEVKVGIPLRLSPETLAAQAAAEDLRHRGGGHLPDIGQVWVHRADGSEWVITGRTTRDFLIVHFEDRENPNVEDPDWQRVTPDHLVDNFTFDRLDCDHAARCCHVHETHSMPHRNCVLR